MKTEEIKDSMDKPDEHSCEKQKQVDLIIKDRKHRRYDDDTSEETEPSEPKRHCLPAHGATDEENAKSNHDFKHWLVFTVVTAGRQGSELGSDQTPLIQFNGILGDFYANQILDRITLNIHPESYTRSHQSSADLTSQIPQSQPTTTTNVIFHNTRTDGHTQPDLDMYDNASDQSPAVNTSTLSSTTETGKFGSTINHVNISTEALQAAGFQDTIDTETIGLTFKEAITKVLYWLKDNGVFNDQSNDDHSSILLISENHQSVRNVLHAEAAYRGFDHELMNRSPWLMYIELIEHCRHFLQRFSVFNNDIVGNKDKSGTSGQQGSKEDQLQSLFDIAHALGIPWEETKLASNKAEAMARIMIELNEKGYRVKDPEFVRYTYEHKTFSRKLKIDDSQVVEVRQVPWTATPATIAHYFAGLNVSPGGVAIRLTDGRRSNTAIVAFDNSINAQLAIARNQHQLCGSLVTEIVNNASDVYSLPLYTNNITTNNNSRNEWPMMDTLQQSSGITAVRPMFLQIHPATGREFVQCTGCDQECVTSFLNQLKNGEQVVVRVRGLPYTTTKKQIVEFFKAVQAQVMLDEQGIYLVSYLDRRPTGDAFVLFYDDYVATKALTRHKDYLGDRYVELFKASPSEMVQVCYNVTQVHSSPSSHKNHSALLDFQSNGRINTTLSSNTVTLTPGNCSNLVNFMNSNNNNNMNNTSHNKETHLNSTLPPLKTVMNSATLSNVANLWGNTGVIPLCLTQNLLNINGTELDSIGLNSTRIPNSTSNISPSIQLIPSTDSSAQIHLLSGIPITNPIICDLTDPTDPECPFARPLPIGGACAMVQLNELPLETSRHDIRLYLGPANFAKVYRMRRMETAPNSHTTSWLLSLINTTEAIQFIRDLVTRSFTLTNQQFKVLPNIPTFALYNVSPGGKLSVIILSDIVFGIPLHRIHPTSCMKTTNTNSMINPSFNWSQQSVKLPITTKYEDQNIFNAVTPHLRLPDPSLTLKRLTLPIRNLDMSQFVNSLPGLNLQSSITPQDHDSLLIPASFLPSVNHVNPSILLEPKPSSFISDISNAQNHCSLPGLTASMVMLTGAPADATQEELASFFNPVRNLLTTQPYFVPFQYQPNGTANFLANFNSPLDAQTAVHYCPNGSLRSSQYVIGAACLVPPVNITTNTNCVNTPVTMVPMLASNNLINSSCLPQSDPLSSGILFIPSSSCSSSSSSSSSLFSSSSVAAATSSIHQNQSHFH
ncbi:unnamed protein product [Heterobilharzia americana]|nr:unnamed protein product [Heterobilharzia americana]